jgi:energy-coupling factor transporter ATP-binding protein EcfA2
VTGGGPAVTLWPERTDGQTDTLLTAHSPMPILPQLSQRQLVVVTGKGGVGKTTIAAALARLLAAAGRRVLLLEIDPRESLHQLLGTEPSGGGIIKVGPRLSVQNLQPRAVVDALVREKVPIGVLAKKIVGSTVWKHFAEGAPGLKEMAVLGYALRTVEGDYKHKADVVVLDAPATGHGASMLAAPLLLSDLVSGGQIGDMAKSLAAFIADPERCGVVLATLAEEMPVQELSELVALLRERMGRPPELVVANGLYPAWPGGRTGARADRGSGPDRDSARSGSIQAGSSVRRSAGPPVRSSAQPPDHQTVIDLWRERRGVNDRELERLRGIWKGPLAEVPLMPLDRSPELLAAVEAVLGGELA